MRLPLVLAAALLAAPVPAFAQDEVSPAVGRLSDPAFQQQTAGALALMFEALLDLDLAPVIDAAARMDGREAIPDDRGTTLREMAGPDAERLPGEMAEKLPVMMGAMAGMAQQMQHMLPAMREAMEGLPTARDN